MTEPKPLAPEVLHHIARLMGIPLSSLLATIALLDGGGTVPFIARYRKEATGALDEVKIRDIEDKLAYFRDLTSRRETILASIGEQGKLTDDLRLKIEATLDKGELEDLYLPFRPKRRTKAMIAREKGLEPLAEYLWSQQQGPQSLLDLAATFLDEAKALARSPRPSKEPDTSSPNASPRQPTSAKPFANSSTTKASSSAASLSTLSTRRKSSRCTTTIARL